jgi:hypothetical protein
METWVSGGGSFPQFPASSDRLRLLNTRIARLCLRLNVLFLSNQRDYFSLEAPDSYI